MKRVTLLLLAGLLITSIAFAAKVKVQHDRIVNFTEVQSNTPPKGLFQLSKVSQSPGVSVAGDRSTVYYDYQSNGGDEKHLAVLPDGSAHVAFMGATDPSGTGTGRQTFYSFSDDFGDSWTFVGGVEPRRAGYHSMDINSMGSAVIASHTTPTGSIIGPAIYVDALAGFGIFTEFVQPRGTREFTWPHVVVPTDDYVFFTGYDDGDGVPAMWSWCNPNTGVFGEKYDLFPEVDNEIRGCTVRSAGGKVTTLLIQGLDIAKLGQWGENNIIGMTSEDYGRTFGDPYIITNFSADTSQEVLPGFWLGLTAVYVGEELHLAWTMVDDVAPTEDGISYFFDTLRIMHWAESVNNGEPTVAVRWDSLHFAASLGSGDIGVNHLHVDYPKIGVDENGTLILSFFAIVGDSTNLDPVTNLAYGEIWAAASADNGLQWGEPVNLTNSIDIDDRYPYLSQWNEAGKLNVMYQSDASAGSFAFNDGAPATQPDFLFLKADIPSTEPYTGPSSVKQVSSVPASYQLEQNYPNPFNPSTTIRFSLEKNSLVKLTVYNMLGERVAVLADGYLNAGTHEATWNASSLSSGLYFYRLEAGNTTLTRKMTLMK